jgi:hypothetical protein
MSKHYSKADGAKQKLVLLVVGGLVKPGLFSKNGIARKIETY